MDIEVIRTQMVELVNSWEAECLKAGHSIFQEVSISDDRRWRVPPFTCSRTKGGFDLTKLLNAYHTHRSDNDDVISAWDAALNILTESTKRYKLGEINKEFNRVFPQVSFGGDAYHPYVNFVQFLKCVELSRPNRKLELGVNKCMITIDGKRIGIDRGALFSSSSGRRTRLSLADLRTPLQCYRGGYGRCPYNRRINGVFRLLAGLMPHRLKEIEAAISVAVQCGDDIERIILEKFDIVVNYTKPDDKTDPSAVITRARALVEVSDMNPIRGLHKLLSGLCKAKAFSSYFGSPYQRISKTYSAMMREKHRSGIERLANDIVIGESKDPKVVDKQSAAEGLMGHFFGI